MGLCSEALVHVTKVSTVSSHTLVLTPAWAGHTQSWSECWGPGPCPHGIETMTGSLHLIPSPTSTISPVDYSNSETQSFLLNTILDPKRSNLIPKHTCGGTENDGILD